MRRIALLLGVALASAGILIAFQEGGAAANRSPAADLEAEEAVSKQIAVAVAPLATIEQASPHPITPERRHLDRQRSLFAAVDAALDANDVTRARQLLREHEATYAGEEAWLDFREGYQLIADCKEHKGPDAAARGALFVSQRAGSTLRRRVRRACLGPRLPSTDL